MQGLGPLEENKMETLCTPAQISGYMNLKTFVWNLKGYNNVYKHCMHEEIMPSHVKSSCEQIHLYIQCIQ